MRRRDLIAMIAGAATLRPLELRAQQKTIPVIGYLGVAAPGPYDPRVAAFRQGLSETGFVEAQNVTIEYRWAEGHYDRLPALAAELVDRKVDVIVASGGPAPARAAKNATSAIPIVFATGGDPVDFGLVASLARPGGNLTGVSVLANELMPKRIELLTEFVPQAQLIGILVNPMPSNTDDLQGAARAKGLRLQILNARNEDEIDAAFTTFVQSHVGAVLVGADLFFFSRREQLVGLAAHHALPTMYEWREFAVAGGLISYGSSRAAAYRQVGIYAGRILKGASPADLPVQQPTTFELVINLKTAKALDLTIPQMILARADEVIE